MSNEVEIIPLDNDFEKSKSDNNQEELYEQKSKEKELKIASKRKWEEANTCPICLSPWSSTGNHQIASLKCGHLFGYSCIIKWLKKKNTKDSRCPCCNSHAIVRNVRKLYSCNLKVEDNSQFESIKKEKIEMEMYCEMLEKEKLHYQIYSRIANEQLMGIKNTISDYKQQLKKLKKKNSTLNKYQFNSTYIIDNNLKSSRILSYDIIGKSLYVTKSLNMQNFGIVKIDLQENKMNEYYQLHEKAIKDIQCNPINGNLLSCSFDKTFQIFSNKTKDIDICVPIDYACWSCCWSSYNENQIFTGLSNNSILMYDIRNLSTYCTKLNGGSNLNKPIHSLVYVNNLNNYNSSKISSGILGANLEDIFYHDQDSIDQNSNDKGNNGITPKLKYQQSGSCVSLCFDPLTQQILSTWRSSSSFGLLTNYNIDYLRYTSSNNDTPIKKALINPSNNFVSSFEYMKEHENMPKYQVSFERRQEIYGYSGQKHLTRNIIFSESKDYEKSNKANDSVTKHDDLKSKKTDETILYDDNNKKIRNNNLETFVCASDEGSYSSIIWKCKWDNDFTLAQHSFYQQLPTENHSVILDIKHCPLTNTHSSVLACLTGDQVFLYRK